MSKEIRAREVIAHPERFEAESAELKAYEATTAIVSIEARVGAIVAILSGVPIKTIEAESVKVEVETKEAPKKKGRPAKKK